MRIGKGNPDEEDYGDDEFGPKRDGPSSNTTVHSSSNNNNSNTAVNKDAKNSDKAAIRSKHSVTEQRRRSKINERFQILRELIPHSDHKRDTASFLLEVIEYVQYLQEKVQKYEGSYPGWSPEPTKLLPWRNSHWRAQGFANHPHAINNGSGQGTTFPVKFEENNMTSTPTIGPDRPSDRQPEINKKGLSLSMSVAPITQSSHGAQSNESPAGSDVPNQTEDLIIEEGTINISSVYSHELLSSLTQALEKAGIDLSNARLSVQIDLGKRSNRESTSAKDPLSDNKAITQPKDHSHDEEESEQSYKRMKT